MDRAALHAPTPAPDEREPARRASVACFLACFVFSLVTLSFFHNKQWNSFDDGAYLHVADRMLQGEVLNREVQDQHAGYINFLNAWAMRLFGNDAVSLRYPLAASGVVNAVLAYWLLRTAGLLYAAAGSVAMTCLSVIQFMNPTANWYCLTLALAAGAVMVRLDPRRPGTQFWLGLLVGLVALFRQLSGVFVAVPVLLYLLMALPQDGRGARTWSGRALSAFMALGIGAYLIRKTDPVALLLYGSWALALLGWGVVHLRATNRDVLRMLLWFTLGGATSALPLAAYHVYHGSLRTWFDDAVLVAVGYTDLPFFESNRYWHYAAAGVKAMARPGDGARVLTGVFWLLALWLPLLLGAGAARWFWTRGARRPDAGRPGITPQAAALPLLGVFYFLVALHLQKFMYFFFGVPLTVVGLLSLTAAARPAVRRSLAVVVFVASAIALLLFAAPFRSIVPNRDPLVAAADHRIPRLTLWLEREQADFYRGLISLVDREVGPDETILSLPVAPEFYYVTGRRNPTRFHNTALGLQTHGQVEALLRQLEPSPPKLVFFRDASTFNSAESKKLMEWVRRRYDRLDDYGSYEVYRSRGAAPPPSTEPAE